jgi:hypothetical protein
MEKTFNCFKFRAVNKFLIDSLVHSTIFLARPDCLNDPFDSNIDIATIIKKYSMDEENLSLRKAANNILSNRGFVERFKKNIGELGICSFSIALHETLMWSHYGDEHKGIAVEYDFPIGIFDNDDNYISVAPTTYKENAVSDWLQENILRYESDNYGFVTELMQKVLTSKAPSWEYEEEGRIISKHSGLIEIHRSALKTIVFGLRTSGADEKLIRTLVSTYYPKVKYKRVMRGGNDFGLVFQDA